jgi:hypothetical protein
MEKWASAIAYLSKRRVIDLVQDFGYAPRAFAVLHQKTSKGILRYEIDLDGFN